MGSGGSGEGQPPELPALPPLLAGSGSWALPAGQAAAWEAVWRCIVASGRHVWAGARPSSRTTSAAG